MLTDRSSFVIEPLESVSDASVHPSNSFKRFHARIESNKEIKRNAGNLTAKSMTALEFANSQIETFPSLDTYLASMASVLSSSTSSSLFKNTLSELDKSEIIGSTPNKKNEQQTMEEQILIAFSLF